MKTRVFSLALQIATCSFVSVVASAADWPVLKTYEGGFRRVKMPIGGIVTGTISLAGNGRLVDWQIFNTPVIGNTPTANAIHSTLWSVK